MKNIKLVCMTLLIAMIAFFIPACSTVESQTTTVRYSWTAPAFGPGVAMKAEKYTVQYRLNGGSWTFLATTNDIFYDWNMPYDVSAEVRVAGIDALNRTGLYSDPSDAYTLVTPPPGTPGKPVHN